MGQGRQVRETKKTAITWAFSCHMQNGYHQTQVYMSGTEAFLFIISHDTTVAGLPQTLNKHLLHGGMSDYYLTLVAKHLKIRAYVISHSLDEQLVLDRGKAAFEWTAARHLR